MQPFDFQLTTKMVCGPGTLERVGELAADLGAKRVLLVTDPGIVAAGHVHRAAQSLIASNVNVIVFDGAHENPTTADVGRGLEIAKNCQPDFLIGLGGGSSMDCAKGINFVYSCGGQMKDYWGVGKATGPMLPMIAIPTTGGTGSEMQSFALISDADTHVKMACGDKRAACKVAILDPQLTVTQPAAVTVLTGIDAVSHAIETCVTTKRTEISQVFSGRAWELLAENFSRVLNDPSDLGARWGMQLGAAYSGIAIENSMLGAAHALANPLTAAYGIAHGQAVGLMLPHVVRFNRSVGDRDYQGLVRSAKKVGVANGNIDEDGAGLANLLTEMCDLAGLKTSLSELDVEEDRLEQFADAASKQWTGTFNPVPVTPDSLLSIYRNAL